MKPLLAGCLAAVLLAAPAALANDDLPWNATLAGVADQPAKAPEGSWLAAAEEMAAKSEVEAKTPPPTGDGPPLPLHTIEGVGGALAVPMAYLVNPGPEGTVIGMPAASVTFLSFSTKNLLSFAVTETLFRRIELGFAVGRFDIGNLGHVAKKVTNNIISLNRRDVWLTHFNVRGLLVEENTQICGIPMPAIVAGVQMKYNCNVQSLDHDTKVLFPEGGFSGIGLERANGIDYVLTMSKMIPEILFGRPLILTFGVRNSQASNFGFTGFGDSCSTTVECDAATLITDWLAVGYEFRQRNDPYDKLSPLHKGEGNLHAIRAAIILNDHLVLAAGWSAMGNVANDRVDCAWGIQVKYEF